MFKKDDVVKCIVNHYIGVSYGEYRTVLGVSPNGSLITLKNVYSPLGYGDYNADNFVLVKREASKKMSRYIGINIGSDTVLDNSNAIAVNKVNTTFIYPTPELVINAITQLIETTSDDESKKWMVCELHSLVEPETPKPPIRITKL